MTLIVAMLAPFPHPIAAYRAPRHVRKDVNQTEQDLRTLQDVITPPALAKEGTTKQGCRLGSQASETSKDHRDTRRTR